jgi:3-isopropylmalate dehydrogenase
MRLKIAVLPGDGVGPEVTRQAVRILRTVGEFCGCEFQFIERPVGGTAITQTGSPLPPKTLETCLESDAVLLGAVGGPDFDKLPRAQKPETGLLQLRSALGGFANIRPAMSYSAIAACSPLQPRVVEGADVLVVRELLGGLYFSEPRGFLGPKNGPPSTGMETSTNAAVNTMRYSVEEIERIAHIAFQAARKRRNHVTSVDKANVLETSQLWRRVVSEVAEEYPAVTVDHMYVDACAMHLVTNPRRFDVILAENLFGDILSDEAAVITGSLGMLGSATIGGTVNLYEPIHGSAPDIAGRNIANPIGAIASAALLLRYTAAMEQEARDIDRAIDAVLEAGYRTADIDRDGSGQRVSTTEMGDCIERALADILEQRHAYHAV